MPVKSKNSCTVGGQEVNRERDVKRFYFLKNQDSLLTETNLCRWMAKNMKSSNKGEKKLFHFINAWLLHKPKPRVRSHMTVTPGTVYHSLPYALFSHTVFSPTEEPLIQFSSRETPIYKNNKTQRQLIARGDYFSTANCRTQKSDISQDIWKFSRCFKFLYLFDNFSRNP
jgi:hypothetical protein